MAVTQIKDGYAGGSDNQLRVNDDGSINVDVSGGGGSSNVNIHDSSGNALTSTGGALNVNSTGSSTVSGTVNTNLNGLTAFQTSQYTVSMSAVQLTPTPMANRSSMSLKVSTNIGTDIVYIGNSNAVTTSTGYALFNGDSLQLDLTPAQAIWAISSGTNDIVYVMEIGD